MCAARKSGGFSLPELVVVLAIAALSLTLVVPGLAAFATGLQIRSSGQALQASLLRARHEALHRNARVVICKSASGTECRTQDRWHDGWILFQDDDGDAVLDAGETVLYRELALPSGVRIQPNALIRNHVSYVGHGNARTPAGVLQMGTFQVCAAGASPISGVKVVLRQTGHTRMERTPPAQCG